jgi:hypothetical protein
MSRIAGSRQPWFDQLGQIHAVDLAPLVKLRGFMKRLLWLFASLATACSDEPPPIDLATCDETEVYRITEVELATSNEQARAFSHDLNNDAERDNVLGMVSSTVAGVTGVDFTASVNARLGELDWRVTIKRCAGERVAVAVTEGGREPETYLEDDVEQPDHHVRGEGIELPLSPMFDAFGTIADPGWIAGDRSVLVFADGDGTTLEATLATALPDQRAFGLVTGAVATFATELFTQDLRGIFDENADGQITVEELRESSFAQSLLAPDIVLPEGEQAISFGLRIHGTRVTP